MAEIRPFQGVHYNPSRVQDPAAVICPPYDIISPQMQQELYRRSEHNFVRLEFGRELPQDKDTDNKYTRAAATMQAWLEQGVLMTDRKPGIYIHDHHFSHQGREYRRRGIIGVVKLEDWDKMSVRPHEGTLTKPKGDRLNLLWALKANTSPILAIFEDGREIIPILEEQSRGEPLLETSLDGELHRLRAITDEAAVGRIVAGIARQPLYIADGHHRYESALTYRRERRTCSPSASEEPYDYVMMTLVDFADPGLVILPAHRLARGISPTVLAGMAERLAEFFEIEETPLNDPAGAGEIDTMLAGNESTPLALYGLKEKSLLTLRLRDPGAIGKMMPLFHSERYRKLAVSVVDHVILEELLGLNPEMVGASIDFSYDARDAVDRVIDGEYQLAFIVSPIKPEDVKAIADSGDRMPRKSTYFYPKTPSGLVLHRFG